MHPCLLLVMKNHKQNSKKKEDVKKKKIENLEQKKISYSYMDKDYFLLMFWD